MPSRFFRVNKKSGAVEEFQKPSKSLRCSSACWPLRSEGAAVNPQDIPRAMEDARRNGVPTEFDADGCPIFTGPRHRNRYLRSVGMFDRSAGYGDPAPNVAGGSISERQATEMVREMCDAVGAAFGIDE